MSLSNRSLERGLSVLECFRPGVGALSHREVADRTGLPKATVSRLLGTLTASGYLVFNERLRAYKLGVAVLSLSRCLAMESRLLQAMSPLIDEAARKTRSIIGFGTAHHTDIVYLEAVNGDPDRSSRQVGPGMRAPIATTSVGHAYLAGMRPKERDVWLQHLSSTVGVDEVGLRKVVEAASRELRIHGYCLVRYAEGRQAAIGVPVPLANAPLFALGIGYWVPKGAKKDEPPAQILTVVKRIVEHAQEIAG